MIWTRRDLLRALPALPAGLRLAGLRPAGLRPAGLGPTGFRLPVASAGLLSLWAHPALAEPTVRIAVGRFRGRLELKGADLRLRGDDGVELARDRPVVLSATPTGIALGDKILPDELVRVLGSGALHLRDHSYRRFLEVHWREYRGTPELLVVHPLPLETYVAGIVSSELPHRWPYEALKVQAICARTYAVWQKYRRLHLPYHLESTVLDQVYQGAQREHDDAHRAAAETAGLLLVHGRRPARTYFHSTCGGHTESAAEGWGTPLPYLPGNRCGYCEGAPLYRWQAKLSGEKFARAFRDVLGGPARALSVVSRSKTDRVLEVRVRGDRKAITLRGDKLRQRCGYNVLWSTWLQTLHIEGGTLHAAGRGAGHGVGMCQWGARGMANAGMEAAQILARYYPTATLRPMY